MVGGRIKTRARAAIARRRHTLPVRAADRVARAIQNAVRNQYNWNLEVNGEALTLELALRRYPGAVFDVGSNYGQWARVALSRIGGRELHCFEVVPAISEELRKNLSGATNVHINDVGLGGEVSTIEVNYYRDEPSVSSRYGIPDENRRGAIERVSVQITTGDNYCRSRGVDRIAMLKVDVEGMECEVLEGFGSMLEHKRIGVVQFEYGFGYIGARRYLGDVCALLSEAGYALYRQFPDGLEPFTYSLADEDFRPRNFVALQRADGPDHLIGAGHGSAAS
jgi:FkbM family methyltransferase